MLLTAKQEKNFFKKVNKTDTCWLWTGCLSNGLGQMGLNKRKYYAHRISYAFHNEIEIPEGSFVRHTCDIPTCVNPAHLRLSAR